MMAMVRVMVPTAFSIGTCNERKRDRARDSERNKVTGHHSLGIELSELVRRFLDDLKRHIWRYEIVEVI